MAFIHMANGLSFQVPDTREGVSATLANASERRPVEIDAEGLQGGNPLVKVSINPAQVVAVTEGPIQPQRQ